MTIHLYAEYLSHIGSLCAYITLSTASNTSTAIDLSSDRQSISIKHDGEEVSIKLPVAVPKSHDAILQIPENPSTTLIYRFRCNTEVTVANNSNALVIPWTATDLTSSTEISCSNCNATLSPRSRIRHWKDLPSDGWAEMMEFWHCHKPNEPHNHDETTSRKGYSAASKLAVEAGVAFVKTMSILFVAEDLLNVEVSQSTSDMLICSSCKSSIGEIDPETLCFALSKSSLSVSYSEDNNAISLAREKWPACALLTAVAHQGLHKLIITSRMYGNKILSVWIFAPNMRISSSDADRDHIVVAKVMWKILKRQETTQLETSLNSRSLSVGALELAAPDFILLEECLQISSALLPMELQTLQDWKVGLLKRFTKADLRRHPACMDITSH